MGQQILILDEIERGELIKQILESADFGYQCDCMPELEEWKKVLARKDYNTLVFHKEDGLKDQLRAVKQMKLTHRQMRVIMIAAELEESEALLAREHFVDEFCPAEDYAALINSIEGVIE